MTEQILIEPQAYLAIFEPFELQIAEYKAENERLVFDYADPKGNKEARGHIYKLRRIKSRIADAHRRGKAEVLNISRQIDAVKNRLIDDFDSMIDVHNQPLLLIEKEKAEAEAARLKAIADAEAARLKAEADAKAEAEAKRMAEIEAREAEVKNAEAAVKAAEEKIAVEQANLAAEQQAQKDETERIRREERIAEEAKAEAAADAKAALEAAERKRIADIAAVEAKAKAEAEAKELAERRRVEAEQAKKAAEAAEKKQAQEDTKHQSKIQDEIYNRLKGLGLSLKGATDVMDAMVHGTIPHVKIEY